MRTNTYLDPNNRVERCTECGDPLDLCLCARVDEKAHERLHSKDGRMVHAIHQELASAREEFPEVEFIIEALMEEVGELAQALMEHSRGGSKTAQDVFSEAVQVATVAIRIGTEGSEHHLYDPDSIFGGE